ncbi:hypothetical protein H4219_004468 [Mycoemilia scoparia]|uniref:Major facilitator superfamily (MFS) profile domain-containing protein n=1 Tax=Mycoemilia scoparia TaxID=417184 RepID=A0A9W7ZY64_9FUNG|nr:hypothetical protein H4219_004468 [Mycoemilia scoparia]
MIIVIGHCDITTTFSSSITNISANSKGNPSQMSDQANQFRDFSRYSTIHNNSHVDDESPQDSTSAATFQALQAVNPESRIQKLARKFTNIGLFNSLYKLKYYRYIVLACCFILSGFSSGTIHTWGIQQEYMVNTMFKNADKKTMMMLDWIGTLQFFFSLFSGIFAGILIKKISVRYTGLVGTTSIALGQILASFSHKPWQFCLCQSILVGAGCCTIYIPGVTTPALFFSGKRAGLVTGIAVAGGGAGGLIMAPITEKLLSIPSLALPGMLRITAIYTFVICGVSSILLSRPDSTQAEDKDEKANSPAPTVFSREITLVESGSLGGDASLSQIKGNVLETPKSNNLNREPETKKSIEWSLLKTPYRLAYCFSTFSVIAGYIIPYSYLPSKFQNTWHCIADDAIEYHHNI